MKKNFGVYDITTIAPSRIRTVSKCYKHMYDYSVVYINSLKNLLWLHGNYSNGEVFLIKKEQQLKFQAADIYLSLSHARTIHSANWYSK